MNADLLTPELHRACKNLLERFDLLGMQTVHLAAPQWEGLDAAVSRWVPRWLPELHAAYPLGHGVLKTQQWKTGSVISFRFLSPGDLTYMLQSDSSFEVLLEAGYFPFADEGDTFFSSSNCWLCRPAEGANSRIYWFDMGDWSREVDTIPHALTFACKSLALFLTCTELVGNRIENPPPVLWLPEEELDGGSN